MDQQEIDKLLALKFRIGACKPDWRRFKQCLKNSSWAHWEYIDHAFGLEKTSVIAFLESKNIIHRAGEITLHWERDENVRNL